jgi:N-acetylglucosaminyl-diphospho-decaprenol L-rhamnosyltransferase
VAAAAGGDGEAVSAARPELGVAIVSYRVPDFLRGCLESLRRAEDVDGVKVCVVDCASGDGTVEMVRREFPEVDLVASERNLGYVGGNNVALARLREGEARPRFLLLLNPDTVVPPRALREMLDLFDRYPDLGAAGPRLHLETGELDHACKRGFPSPTTSLYHMIGLSRLFPRSRRFGRYRLTFVDERALADVDSVVGAFMLVRDDVVATVGLLDDDFFMYGEDLDWAFRIKRAGWRVVYNGRVDVLHYKRQSSRQSVRAVGEFYRAMRVFFRKHYAASTPGPLAFLIETAIRAMGTAAVVRRRMALRGAAA